MSNTELTLTQQLELTKLQRALPKMSRSQLETELIEAYTMSFKAQNNARAIIARTLGIENK